MLRFVNHKRNRREAAIRNRTGCWRGSVISSSENAQAFPNGSPWLLPAIGGRNGQGQQPYHHATLLTRVTNGLPGLSSSTRRERP